MPRAIRTFGDSGQDNEIDLIWDAIRKIEQRIPAPTNPPISQPSDASAGDTLITVQEVDGDPTMTVGGIEFGTNFDVQYNPASGFGLVNYTPPDLSNLLRDPTQVSQDLIYRPDDPGPPDRLALGVAGTLLGSRAGAVQYVAPALSVLLPLRDGDCVRTGGAASLDVSTINANLQGTCTNFVDASDSSAYVWTPVPRYLIANTSFTIRIKNWVSTVAIAEDLTKHYRFVVSLVSLQDLEDVSAAVTYGDNVALVTRKASYIRRDTDVTISNYGGLAGGESLWIRVRRDPTHADDDAVCNVAVEGIEILAEHYT